MHKIPLYAALVASFGAHADSPPAAVDWSADRFLIGKWACHQTRDGRETGQEEALYALDSGARWLRLVYTLRPTGSKHPSKTTTSYETFDAALDKWVYISIGSDGDYGISYSAGWKGNAKAYGPPADAPQNWRLIATKISDDEFTEDIDAVTSDGTWRRTVSLVCRRVISK
jgi:hypothetical protein